MATVSISAPSSKFSYFTLNNQSDISAGYNIQFVDNGRMYIGAEASSGTSTGGRVGVFGFKLYDITDRTLIQGIESLSFKIFTTNSAVGWNGCSARIEYIGTTATALQANWRVGSSSETISLKENANATITTSNQETCSNFENLIKNAVSGQYYYFRLVRESGMGARIDENIELTINYSGSSAKRLVSYIWGTSTQTYTYPETAMTSNSSANCVASASSVYGTNYAAWRAFNKSNSDHYGWASLDSESEPWIQLQMPQALENITIKLVNRTKATGVEVNGPKAGYVQGSNNGTSWTPLASFSGFDGTTSAGVSGTISCNNSIAYKYVRITLTESGGAIGEIYITGTKTLPEGWIGNSLCLHFQWLGKGHSV